MSTRLVRKANAPGYWVRSVPSGRTLGTVERHHGKTWVWAPSSAAFRGDGRPGLESDGVADHVPADLLDPEGTQAKTRDEAVDALVAFLTAFMAPVMGFGPHPRVQRQDGLRRLEEVEIRAW